MERFMKKSYFKEVVIALLVAFIIGEEILINKYETLNESLQTALSKCIGLEKVGE